MSDLPFKAEYAKSGRASCRGCKTTIPKDSLRIAAMLQSAFFDGKQPNWYHDTCFFKKQRPKTVADISYFSSLRYEDQENIRKSIESLSTGTVMPEAKSKKKSNKRSNAGSSQASLKDFGVEYSKSSRATCKTCDIKITKGEVRISKIVFDTEIGQKFGGQPLWHHVGCFAKDRSTLLFFGGGELLPGFDQLKKEDRDLVKKELPAMKSDEVPIKKIKKEPGSEEDKKVATTSGEDKILKAQNLLYYKYRDLVEKNCSKKDFKLILEFNNQQIPAGDSRMLNSIADIMCFGALSPCDVCKNGQLFLNTNGYVCRGDLTEWTKCSNVTKTPGRVPFKVPKSLQDNDAFKRYKFKKQERKFIDEVPSTSQTIKTESATIKTEKPVPPLKNLQFYIHGFGSKIKDKLKIKILKLGGSVPSKITATLAAVVSTHEEVGKLSKKILEAQDNDIQVLEDAFFDLIKPDGAVSETLKLIDEHNIAPWGSTAASRIPKDVLDGKSNKSKSIYSKSSSMPTRLVIKDGTAVDPDADVDDDVKVYVDKKNGDKFSAVLGLTDIVSQKNSFYKLQLLKKESSNRFWLFRSWGRIGTTIGGKKTEKCSTLQEALEKFEDLYEEKTGYPWMIRNQCDLPKIPGKMYPIDIDYGENGKQEKRIDFDNSTSKLPIPVQKLIKMIFDIDIMKQTMLEFQLDTEKMPLGKLSRKQLTSGYNVLTSLLNILKENNDTKLQESLIVDATNRFYTLVPHDFGVENPPLLNNDEIIKTKSSMLDSLIEMEIAYKLLNTASENEDDTVSPLDSHYIKLKSEIVPLDVDSPEFEILNKYVKNSHAATHSSYELEIQQVFKVAREGEDKRFKPFQKLPNRRLLWHGSRVTNFAGILSQGLRIAPPEAPVTGYMFGKGIYFADMVSKSANYCCTNVQQPVGIMLLCEVALGNMKELTAADYVQKLEPDYHSVKGVGKTEPNPKDNLVLDCGTIVPIGKPVKKKCDSHLLYNEYIVYDIAQVKVKYLFEMKFKYNYS